MGRHEGFIGQEIHHVRWKHPTAQRWLTDLASTLEKNQKDLGFNLETDEMVHIKWNSYLVYNNGAMGCLPHFDVDSNLAQKGQRALGVMTLKLVHEPKDDNDGAFQTHEGDTWEPHNCVNRDMILVNPSCEHKVLACQTRRVVTSFIVVAAKLADECGYEKICRPSSRLKQDCREVYLRDVAPIVYKAYDGFESEFAKPLDELLEKTKDSDFPKDIIEEIEQLVLDNALVDKHLDIPKLKIRLAKHIEDAKRSVMKYLEDIMSPCFQNAHLTTDWDLCLGLVPNYIYGIMEEIAEVQWSLRSQRRLLREIARVEEMS